MNPSNIASYLPKLAQQQPDTMAVTEQKSGRQYTFQQLDEVSDIIAKGLQEIGIGKGVHTALMVTPGLDFFALVFALFKVGAVMIAIDPGIGAKQLGKCLAEAEPVVFIGIKKAHFARRVLGWASATLKTNIIVNPGVLSAIFYGRNISSLKQLKQSGSSSGKRAFVDIEADDVAAILFTSGSTGAPKGVVYTHANFTAQVNTLRTLYGIQAGEIDLATFPLFALFGPAMGMSSIIPDMDFTRPGRVDPEIIFSAIEKYKTTTMFGSPALLNHVGRYGEQQHKKLPNMKRVLSAGAPVPANVMKRFTDMLHGNAQVFTPYGATESLPVSSIGSNEVLGSTCYATEQGHGVCVGRPVDNIELKIITITDKPITNWRNDLILGANIIGEIAVKGPQVTKSYHARQQTTELAKINDVNGDFYHRMGDTGYLDEQGRLWLCGRMIHRVVTGNKTLFTIPCEGIFNTHEKVFRTALVGVLRNNETIPVICVELEEEFGNHDKNLMTEELLIIGAQFEQTSSIQTVLFHSAFPVDIRHNAKIGREKLAVWAHKKISRQQIRKTQIT